MSTVAQTGEDALIQRLRKLVPARADVVAGIGDDCAVVRTGRRDPYDLLLKSDPVIEGIHFLPSAPSEAVGHKAVGRVLSDMAAMGGEPLWLLVNLVVPARQAQTRVEGMYRGMSRLARRYGMAIVGGDTSRGEALALHVFGVGRVPRGTAVLRSGAVPGDEVYATGSLGGSIRGRHLRFEPRLAEGDWLRSQGWARAMMDLSDGLATDARRLAVASGVDLYLDAGRIPVSTAARAQGGRASALHHALTDGEDFELLFTVSPRKAMAFRRAWAHRFPLACRCIGRIEKGAGAVWLHEAGHTRPLDLHGYEHF